MCRTCSAGLAPVTEDQFDAYQSLAEESEDHRWAFGTGFTDPLEGVDTAVPDGVDAAALAAYCLMLADDALVYSHRLQQWMTRAARAGGGDRARQHRAGPARPGPDAAGAGGPCRRLRPRRRRLAFFRERAASSATSGSSRRCDADFAELTARLLVFSAWRLALLSDLAGSADPVLAAIAAKGAKELTYHRDYAAQWVVRLGDGTALSHEKMQAALAAMWPLVGELFRPDPVADALPGVAVRPEALRAEFDAVLGAVLAEATLHRPPATPVALVDGRGGRDGVHTEAFGYLLAELQSLARAHPDATW